MSAISFRKPRQKYSAFPTLGQDALDEIKEALAQIGLHLNMDVPGWPPDDIEDLAKHLLLKSTR
jgi:DNA-directed RNA polymerase alpha subunit